jgi:hypothetical protein
MSNFDDFHGDLRSECHRLLDEAEIRDGGLDVRIASALAEARDWKTRFEAAESEAQKRWKWIAEDAKRARNRLEREHGTWARLHTDEQMRVAENLRNTAFSAWLSQLRAGGMWLGLTAEAERLADAMEKNREIITRAALPPFQEDVAVDRDELRREGASQVCTEIEEGLRALDLIVPTHATPQDLLEVVRLEMSEQREAADRVATTAPVGEPARIESAADRALGASLALAARDLGAWPADTNGDDHARGHGNTHAANPVPEVRAVGVRDAELSTAGASRIEGRAEVRGQRGHGAGAHPQRRVAATDPGADARQKALERIAREAEFFEAHVRGCAELLGECSDPDRCPLTSSEWQDLQAALEDAAQIGAIPQDDALEPAAPQSTSDDEEPDPETIEGLRALLSITRRKLGRTEQAWAADRGIADAASRRALWWRRIGWDAALVALERGNITEGQASQMLGLDRVRLRWEAEKLRAQAAAPPQGDSEPAWPSTWDKGDPETWLRLKHVRPAAAAQREPGLALSYQPDAIGRTWAALFLREEGHPEAARALETLAFPLPEGGPAKDDDDHAIALRQDQEAFDAWAQRLHVEESGPNEIERGLMRAVGQDTARLEALTDAIEQERAGIATERNYDRTGPEARAAAEGMLARILWALRRPQAELEPGPPKVADWNPLIGPAPQGDFNGPHGPLPVPSEEPCPHWPGQPACYGCGWEAADKTPIKIDRCQHWNKGERCRLKAGHPHPPYMHQGREDGSLAWADSASECIGPCFVPAGPVGLNELITAALDYAARPDDWASLAPLQAAAKALGEALK